MDTTVALVIVLAMMYFSSAGAADGPRLFAYPPSTYAVMTASASQATTASTAAATVPSASSTQSANSPNAPEMTSQESQTTFKVNVHLVEVRVVVRDAHGKAVGTLKKEDFKIFDNGKLQVISKFDVEKPGQRVAEAAKSTESSRAPTNANSGSSTLSALPERYIAYLFDDIHLANSDLLIVREAALNNFASLQPTDRAAIFTTSGRNEVNFTDDRNKLREALNHLMTHSLSEASKDDCPKMTYYIADRIVNENDQTALAAITQDALICAFGGDPHALRAAQNLARETASQGEAVGETDTRLALASLKDFIRRLAAAPGQRSIILVSPGFITPQHQYDVDEIIDRAVRADVSISTLDARGLYVLVPGGDISQSRPDSGTISGYERDNAIAQEDVMGELADGTGGTFFHNSNDLVGGFRQLASAPEYYYLLGFSPQNLKPDGHFHKLDVTLNTSEKYSLQARRGYFAPKQLPGPDQQAKQDIEDAVFSQEEIHELPINLQTQFFKASDTEAKLTVLAHVDVKQLHFEKVDGRNNDDLTIVSVIFDRNGNFVTGIEKTLQMHLKDETLAYRLGSGLSVKSNFDLKPGGYLVRLVVRDTRGQISAENGVVEIP
jgi:VWFA-related protein